MGCETRRRRASLIVGAAVVLSSSWAAAQAWVNPEGELSLNLRSDYQTSDGVWHGPTLVTGLPVTAINNSLSAEYVPVDKLAVGLAINGNGVSYTGPQSIPGSGLILAHGSQDDGNTHWNVTDLDLDARYQAYSGAVTLTPVARFRTPVTSYEQKGYAAAGSHLMEGGVGVYLGKEGLFVEDLILQASYTFTFVQKETGGGAETEQYRVNRSDADLTLSYIFTDKFIVSAGAALRWTHDGFDLGDYPMLPATSTLIQWHDPVLRARYFAPAVVASYQFLPSWSVTGRFATIVWGENVSNPLVFGVSLGYTTNLLE